MHLSPWVVYLILQLDSFSTTLLLCTLLGGFAAGLIFLVASVNTDVFGAQNEREQQQWAAAKRAGFRFLWLSVLSLLINAALPSTRAMAAIVVLPAIVNNQNVQKEAGELYQLAKQGLAKAVDNIGKEKPKSEEEKQSE